jgi:HKD family nuclease
MKIEPIFNKGPASMGPEIMEQFDWAKEVNIASAFVSSASLDRIQEVLEKAKNSRRHLKINLLVGLYQRFVSAATIAKALGLCKRYPESFSIRIARNNRFHWKLYIFTKREERRIYVGSANFTEDGLSASGELSVKITVRGRDKTAKLLEAEFEVIWNEKKHSFSPDKKFLKTYKRFARRPRHVRITKDDPIGRLLYNAQRIHRNHPTEKADESTLKPRTVFASEDLLPETVKKIRKYRNNWDENGWDYVCLYKRDFESTENTKLILYVTHYKHKIPPADQFKLGFYKIEATAELETPDGRYFIAASHIPYSKIVDYGNVKDELRKVGLTWKKLRGYRSLNKDQTAMLCQVLHIRMETLLAKLD